MQMSCSHLHSCRRPLNAPRHKYGNMAVQTRGSTLPQGWVVSCLFAYRFASNKADRLSTSDSFGRDGQDYCDVRGRLTLQPGQLPIEMSGETVQSAASDSFAEELEKESSRMENVWNRTMHQQYQISDRYNHVAALIVRWDDELDKDLNCKYEV